MDVPLLAGAGVLAAVVTGPWLARTGARLAARDDAATAGPVRILLTTVVLAAALAAVAAGSGLRPATLAFAWAAGAGVVLATVDLAAHRLPDRVTYPAGAVCLVAFAADAALLGSGAELLRAVVAASAALAVGCLAAAAPDGPGFGDVKLLGLLGLVLGWVGWEVLLAGVVLGLLAGSAVSLALLVSRRAGWRTPVPFGPPLLVGAALALALAGPLSLV